MYDTRLISTPIIIALILLFTSYRALSVEASNIDNDKRIKAAYDFKNQAENNLNNVFKSLALFNDSEADYIVKTTVSLIHDYNGFLEEVNSILGERYIYENKQVPQKLVNISTKGRNSGVDFQRFKPLPEKEHGPYKLIEIEIQIKGKINSITNFFQSISDYTIISSEIFSIINDNNLGIEKNAEVRDETHKPLIEKQVSIKASKRRKAAKDDDFSGQQAERWLEKLENPFYSSQKLKEKNEISKYLKYDFSALLMPRSKFLGYIGTDYKRIRINYTSITKDTKNPEIYYVKGSSLVEANKCDFEGMISIQQIREYQDMHFGCDDEFKNAGFKAQGLLIGEYMFKESPKQKYSGIFKGLITMYWYVNKDNKMLIDDIESSCSDGYKNNQYVGTWAEYNTKKEKVCNWGERRIPFSSGLDTGAAYFYPDREYHKNGWEDFKGME